MIAIVLYCPEIPPNTGNIIRLCANTGCELHLIEPLGFALDDKHMRRAGLDYHEYASMKLHPSWEACREALAGRRFFAITTKGSQRHDQPRFTDQDVFLFGQETRGLPPDIMAQFPEAQRLRLPMRPGQRSMNLSNAAAVMAFTAWGQLGYPGGV